MVTMEAVITGVVAEAVEVVAEAAVAAVVATEVVAAKG
jgi:hypothetical protein